MHTITVAIADSDRARRARHEQSLQQIAGITLLTNAVSSRLPSDIDRREESRSTISPIEDEIARAKRLKPNVLLVDLDLLQDSDCFILKSMRYECPETKVVLLTNDSENEDLILDALEAGARGYLSREAAQQHLSKAASLISQGEIWVSRKMLGKIMDRIQIHNMH